MSSQPCRSIGAIIAAAVVAAVVSCDSSPTAPTPRPTGAGSVPGPPVTVVRLEMTAPESIAPDSSVQLRVRVVRSDGSTEDATERAAWTSSNSSVMQVTSGGLATARNRGDARITARADNRSISLEILSLPAGTFRLVGHVTEDGVPLSGVGVSVIAGTGEGLTATSDGSGLYRLYGVAGPIRLHGKKPGYHNLIRETHVAANTTFDMQMAADAARPDVNGAYTLILSATNCPSTMPAEALRRTYDAVVERQGPRLSVRLGGASFIVTNGQGAGFDGSLQLDGRVDFGLGSLGSFYYYYYYYANNDPPHVVERLGPTESLLIWGHASATLNRDTIAGTLNGTFAVTSRTSAPFWPHTSTCSNARHGFELRRR